MKFLIITLAAVSMFINMVDAWEFISEINDIECTCCRSIKGKIDIKNIEVVEEDIYGLIELKLPRTIYGSLIPSPRNFDMILIFIESSHGKSKNIGCHNLGFFTISPKKSFLNIKTEFPVFKIPKYVFERSDKVSIIFKKRIPGL